MNKKNNDISPEFVIREYASLIKRSIRILAWKYLDNPDDFFLEDVYQEVNLRIWKGCLNTFRHECSLEYYLDSFVVSRTFFSMIKKESRRRDYVDLNPEPEKAVFLESEILEHYGNNDHTNQLIDKIVINDIINGELSSMPARWQDIYRMVILEHLTQDNISSILGITQSTVSEYWSKITIQLKRALLRQIPELRDRMGK